MDLCNNSYTPLKWINNTVTSYLTTCRFINIFMYREKVYKISQSFACFEICLLQTVFSHGQLYVGLPTVSLL